MFRVLVKKLWIACVALFGMFIWHAIQVNMEPVIMASIVLVLFILLLRYGLIACMAYEFGLYILARLPITLDFDRWYASLGLLGTGIMLALIAACCVRAATQKQASSSLVPHQA